MTDVASKYAAACVMLKTISQNKSNELKNAKAIIKDGYETLDKFLKTNDTECVPVQLQSGEAPVYVRHKTKLRYKQPTSESLTDAFNLLSKSVPEYIAHAKSTLVENPTELEIAVLAVKCALVAHHRECSSQTVVSKSKVRGFTLKDINTDPKIIQCIQSINKHKETISTYNKQCLQKQRKYESTKQECQPAVLNHVQKLSKTLQTQRVRILRGNDADAVTMVLSFGERKRKVSPVKNCDQLLPCIRNTVTTYLEGTTTATDILSKPDILKALCNACIDHTNGTVERTPCVLSRVERSSS